jgi:hypothetical protein
MLEHAIGGQRSRHVDRHDATRGLGQQHVEPELDDEPRHKVDAGLEDDSRVRAGRRRQDAAGLHGCDDTPGHDDT